VSGFVYRWHDRKHDRYYFGSHWGPQDDGYVCSSTHMKRAYKKRPDDFHREIVATVTASRKDLLRREQTWLDTIHHSQLGKCVYNLNRRVDDQWFADDQKRMTVSEKIRAAMKGKTLSPEHRARIGAAAKGRTHTPEHRARIGAVQRGKILSPEHRSRIRAALKGKPQKPHTPETRAKLSVAAKGKTHTPETREKLRIAQRGKPQGPHSAETRAKMSASHKCRPRCRCVTHGVTGDPGSIGRWHSRPDCVIERESQKQMNVTRI
jgi:hypothetical protein